jgi:hypothetical protein
MRRYSNKVGGEIEEWDKQPGDGNETMFLFVRKMGFRFIS